MSCDKLKISLPIAEAASPIRRSKNAKWRAVTLIGVHLLILAHVVWWLTAGRAVTPVEPSEAMAWSRNATVNAGAIFFGLAIVSTFVFGRFFCGWGCHLVALQDLCRWILMRLGIRPRAFRSRVLLLVPPIAFGYMFLLPLWNRLVRKEFDVAGSFELTTTEFWATFPGAAIALLTFLICGFAIVYFLGSKGFCTYACPYGGVFAPVDRLAVGRIRVTSACEGCGHCTATCTSNVDVKHEVRTYGKVVDPGCMKCMDCVSVCPKDALYFGFGLAGDNSSESSRTQPVQQSKGLPGGPRKVVPWALFSLLCLAVLAFFFQASWSWVGWTVASLVSVWLGYLVGGAKGELSLTEEALLAVAFVVALISFRGLYEIPFLMALGWAAILAFGVLTALRLMYVPFVRFQNLSLRKDRRLTRAGKWAVPIFGAVGVLWIHSGYVRYNMWVMDSIAGPAAHSWWTEDGPLSLKAPITVQARRKLEDARLAAGRVLDWSLMPQPRAQIHSALLAAKAGAFEEARSICDTALEGNAEFFQMRLIRAFSLLEAGNEAEGLNQLRQMAQSSPDDASIAVWYARELLKRGQFEEARLHCEASLSRHDQSAGLHHNLAVLEMIAGQPALAVQELIRAVELDPARGRSLHFLGEGLLSLGEAAEALPYLERAQLLLPGDEDVLFRRIECHVMLGQPFQALSILEVYTNRNGESDRNAALKRNLEQLQDEHP